MQCDICRAQTFLTLTCLFWDTAHVRLVTQLVRIQGQGAAGTGAVTKKGADTYVTAEFLWSSRNPVSRPARVVLGCGSSPPKPQNALQAEMVGAPKWAQGACQLGLQNKKAICGTGSVSGMTNVALARSAAEGRARTELARSLETRVQGDAEGLSVSRPGRPENKTASEQFVQDASKQVTVQSLSGTRLEDTWISNTGTFWALVVLDVDASRTRCRP